MEMHQKMKDIQFMRKKGLKHDQNDSPAKMNGIFFIFYDFLRFDRGFVGFRLANTFLIHLLN